MFDEINSRRGLRALARRRRRRYLWWLAVPAALVLGAGVWVGVRGYLATQELESAQVLVSEIKAQAVAFDIEGASANLDELAVRTASAASLTSDPVWRTLEWIPWAGSNLTAVRQLAEGVDDVVVDVVGPLLDVGRALDPANLVPKDGAIDTTPFVDAVPAVQTAYKNSQVVLAALNAISVDGAIPPIREAKDKVVGLFGEVEPLLETLNTLVPFVPPLLGADGPRTYAVMFQNNAEARALGGTALSFAVINVDHGKIDLTGVVAAGLGNFSEYGGPVITPPDGVEEVFPDGAFGRFIANATIRPSFVTAAEITQAMWIHDRGFEVDGIVSIDPVALSYFLRATDPVSLSTGDQLTSENLVTFLLNTVYQRFNSGDVYADNAMQDVVFTEAVAATFSQLMGGNLRPQPLVGALIQSWEERRILFWSSHEDEQTQLAAAGFAGDLPESDEQVDRIGLYFQENVGSKLNYYLQQSAVLSTGVCRSDGLPSYRLDVNLVNLVKPEDVPFISPSVTGQWSREGLPPGVQRMIAYVYAPPGTQIVGGSVNGTPVALTALHDTDYPVARVTVLVPLGATTNLTFDLVASDTTVKSVELVTTPMVWPTTVEYAAADCSVVPQS